METDEESNADYWNAEGLSRGKDRRFEDAIVCFDRAIQIDADHAKAWYNKGLCLKNLGLYSESLACFSQAVLLVPNDADSFNKRREVAAKLRNEAHASNAGMSHPPHNLARILRRWPVGVISTIILLFCVWLAVDRSSHSPEGQINSSTVAKIDDSTPAKPAAQVEPTGKPLPSTKDHEPVSLPNGTVLFHIKSHKRPCKLTVDNGTRQDAVVKMVSVDTHRTYRKVYISHNNQVVVPGVKLGAYELKFELGRDWDGKHFRDDKSFSKFDDAFAFTETRSQEEFGRGSIIYDRTWRVTLNPVPEGKAHTSSISEHEFDETE